MQSFDGCKLNNWDSLVALFNWDTQKDSLTVVNDKLVCQSSVTMDSDTIRKVTQTVYATLETLYRTVIIARKQLISHAPVGNLADCADTLNIFLAFWQTSSRNKIEKVIKTAEDEDASRIKFFKLFTNRDEIDRLKAIFNTLKESKEIPSKFTFKSHNGRNIAGLLISETMLIDQHSTVERRVYRISGGNYPLKNEKCSQSYLSLEIHRETYKQEARELFYLLENGAPTLRLCHVPQQCYDNLSQHDCPVVKAKQIVEQVLSETGVCSIVAPETGEYRSFVWELRRKRSLASDVLQREHPFFAQIKP